MNLPDDNPGRLLRLHLRVHKKQWSNRKLDRKKRFLTSVGRLEGAN